VPVCLVVNNGSKRFAITSSGIGKPWSSTSIVTYPILDGIILVPAIIGMTLFF